MDQLLSTLSERIGVTIGPERRPFVQADLQRVAGRLHENGAKEGWERHLLSLAQKGSLDDPLLSPLVQCLTIPESYFFRDQAQFEMLQNRLLPELLPKPDLRILSAGCSSGEELYSVAILLSQACGGDTAGRNWHLLGADVSAGSVQRARAGHFSNWSLRGMEPEQRERYFRKETGGYQLVEEIRRLAAFQVMNLNSDWLLPPQDLILFRNVSIYFPPGVRERILSNLIAGLRQGGILIVGAAELALESIPQLACLGSSVYRKVAPPTLVPRVRFSPPLPQTSRPRSPLPVTRSARPARPAPPAAKLTAAPLERARQFADRGDLGQAELCCREHLTSHPEDVNAHYLLGVTQQSAGHPDDALSSFRTAVYLDRNFVAAHFSLALLYAQRHLDRAARRHFLQVQRLLSESEPASIHPNGQTSEQILAITLDQLSLV